MNNKDKEKELIASEVVSNSQMCNLLAELTADVEGLGAKLNFPYYHVRERDKQIKEHVKGILSLLADEGIDYCERAKKKIVKLKDY